MTEEQESLHARLMLLIPINNLQSAQQEQVLRYAEILDIKKRNYVFRQGDRDNWTFYVLEGELEMFADDQLIKRVVGGEGASFHALAQLQPRQMSARAKTKVKILRLDRGLVDRLLSVENNPGPATPDIEVTEIDIDASGEWLTDMLQSELFAHVPPSNIQKLLETLESVAFKAGEVVIEQGAPGDYYYAIQSGRCEVLRSGKGKKPIKLAELGPGARFGEEALVSNAKRNATVKMLTDGELARLTKADFVELIKKPIMSTCTLDEARALVVDGAKWLDVRFPEEQKANGLEDSLNIPLSSLRGRLQELNADVRYIAYCDTGGRSSVAAFLLTQEGFDVSYVEGGAIDEVPLKPGVKPATAKRPAQPAPRNAGSTSKSQEAIVAADIRAQSLAADLEKANLQIELAKRLMAEAQAAKDEVDRVIREKLQAERSKLEAETAAVRTRLAEAQRIKDEIERQQKLAAAEAEQHHREQEQRTAALEREADRRLHEEEDRIEELYRQQAEKLGQMEEEREMSKAELKRAWETMEAESTLSKERLEAAQELESKILRKEQRRAAELEEKENHMRATMQMELDIERKKLEAEFAKTAEEIQSARSEQKAAQAAKVAAADEAQRIIQEYKEGQQKLQLEQHAKLLAQRQQSEADAARLKVQLDAAATARTEAEAIKREAEAQLARSRDRPQTIDNTEASLRQEIDAIEERARAATELLRTAIAVENDAEHEHYANEKRLERTYGTAKEINLVFQQELDDWVAEQERIQGSTAGRKEIEKHMQQTERIKARAIAAQRDGAAHDASLLDDIAAQLGSEL